MLGLYKIKLHLEYCI